MHAENSARERPILFNAPMVKTTLGGQKTVTRRSVKGMALDWLNDGFDTAYVADPDNGLSPYGYTGDLLWVREAWAADTQLDAIAPRELSQGEPICYLADGALRQTGCSMITQGKARRSFHMPRWVSRILLEVTALRIERLQDITEQQAMAEGITCVPFRPDDGWPICDGYMVGKDDSKTSLAPTAKKAFSDLWNSTGGDWDANPWVWVVEFKRVMP